MYTQGYKFTAQQMALGLFEGSIKFLSVPSFRKKMVGPSLYDVWYSLKIPILITLG